MAPIAPGNLVPNTQYMVITTNNHDLQTPVVFLGQLPDGRLSVRTPSGVIRQISSLNYTLYVLGDPSTPVVTGVPIRSTDYTQGAASTQNFTGVALTPMIKVPITGAAASTSGAARTRRRSRRSRKTRNHRRSASYRRH